MIKLRYKFYIVLFVIFLTISISFTVILLFTTNSSRNDTKNVYYNMQYESLNKDIAIYAENISSLINSEESVYNNLSSDERKEQFLNLLDKINIDNINFEIYVQSIVHYEENDVFVHTDYSSKYNDMNNVSSEVNSNLAKSNKFYPSYDFIKTIVNNNFIHNSSVVYDESSSSYKTRVFYSKYIPNLSTIVTCCFYEEDLKLDAENYMKNIELENKSTISYFLMIMIVAIMALFLFLCYIESLYYKRMEDQYITEKMKSEEKYKQLKKLSQTDALTKCFNRKYLNDKMNLAFKTFMEGQLVSSVILFDIDNFKKVNDTYGHLAGDEVLKQVAEVVRNCIRKEDILARWGGEEFVIFFKYTNIKSAIIVAEKIRSSIEKLTIKIPNQNINVTVSIGVSAFKITDSDSTECIERADDAMYVSKRSGKNKVTLYNK